MIATTSATARAPRRPRRRLATIGLVAVLLSAGAPALAATPTASPEVPNGELELVLAPAGNGVFRPGQPLTTSTTIQNDTAETAAAGRVSLELGTTALPDRSALNAWLDGDGVAEGVIEIGAADLDAVPSAETETASLAVAADDPTLSALSAGVYPLRATAQLGPETLSASSVLVVPDDAASVPVGVVVPITAPASGEGVIDTEELTALTAPDGALTAQLDAVEGTSAILAVDPAVAASIRVLGTAAPDTALEWLARLTALPNARFALQYGDADLATQVGAGLPAPLQPTSLAAYISPATLVPPTATPDPSASPSPAPTTDAAVLPDLAALTAIGPAQAGMFWPATGSAGATTVATLGALTVDGAPSLTLIDSASASGSSSATLPARASAGSAQLLVYDTAVSSALADVADADQPADRAAALARAGAQLAMAGREAGGRPLLVTVDRGDDTRERAALRAAVTSVTGAPGAQLQGLAALTGAEPVAVEVAGIPADAARVGDLTQLLGEENALASFATILDDAAMLTGPERADILRLLSTAWSARPDDARAAVATHRTQTQATMDAVGILPSSVVNLISYGAELGPWVRNDLGYPINAVLIAQPDDPRLVVEERTEVRAEADQNTRVGVPVQARVGNGAVTITMQLYSPTGVAIGAVQSADVEVRAEWETYGLIILGVLMVGFIGLGIIRTVRRRRRARLPADAAVDAEAAEAALHPRVTTEPDDGSRP